MMAQAMNERFRVVALCLSFQWAVRMRENPLDATQNGVRDYDD